MTAIEILAWLMDTSLAVSALVALILVVRRKVAAHFGAEAAYLLWLAPLVRLFLPDLPLLPSAPLPARSAADGPFVLAGDIAAAPASDYSAAVVFAFAAGAVLFILFQLYAQRRFVASMLKDSTPPSAALQDEAAACAGRIGLRRLPAVRVAATRTGPLVAGVLRPVIILPAGFTEDFARAERDLVLAHELTHVRRGDLLFAFAALLFRALQWPNPLAHVAYNAFRIDQEAACDAQVIAAKGAAPDISYAYGAALLKSAAHAPAAPAASLAMSNHLKERLMRLKHSARSNFATGRAAAAAIVIAALAFSASYSAAAAKDPEGAAPTAEKTVRQIEVFTLNADEALAPEGASEAHRIEIEEKDGLPVVRGYDAEGKLLFERPAKSAPADRKVMIIRKKGDEKGARAAPEVFAWESDDDDGEDGKMSRRKVIVMEPGEKGAASFTGDCKSEGRDALFFSESDEDGDKPGEKRVMTQVICLDGEAGADPAKRADALRVAIARLEDSAKREAEQREKMIAKLKEALAQAEREAKKKK